MKHLVIPAKHDPELEAVAAEWARHGGNVSRLDRFWETSSELAQARIAIYGGVAFSLVVAQLYGVDLVSPDDAAIAALHERWTRRNIALRTLGDLGEEEFPLFVKPIQPKLFRASIWRYKADLAQETRDLDPATPCLVSEIVPDLQCEARSFIREDTVLDSSIYEGQGDILSLEDFARSFAIENSHLLPQVYVVDFGHSPTRGWLVIEFNACWGAGLNGCSAAKVLEAIEAATTLPVPKKSRGNESREDSNPAIP